MFFEKIEMHNFGIYRGTHSVPLKKNEKKNIILVGGMNGRGKTTLLDAIFLTFYGKRALPLIQDNVKNYSQLMQNYINKSATDQWTYVSVSINLEDDGPTKLTITRSWTAQKRGILEELVVIKDGREDKYLSDNWNYYVEEILPFGISRFFFFDNEKIAQIADDESFEQIKDSIKAVMGVTTIDKLLTDLQNILKEKRVKTESLSCDSTYEDMKAADADIEEIEKSIAKIRMDRASVVPKLERTIVDLEAAEERFWKVGGNLGLKREEIEKEKEKLQAIENEVKQKQLALAINPATPLVLCRKLVTKTYDAAKNAERKKYAHYSLPVVQQLIDRLMEKLDALDIDAVANMKIRILLAQELQYYSTVSDNVEDSPFSPTAIMLLEKFINEGCNSTVQEKDKLIKQLEETAATLAQIDSHLSNNAEKGDAADVLALIRKLDIDKVGYQNAINELDQKAEALEGQLETAYARRKRLINKIADMETVADDDQRILAYTAKSISVMEAYKLKLQKSKVAALESNITKCFRFLSQKVTVITKVEINPETLDITLKDYKGGVLLKSQLSAGEKQMFSISIIWGLALTSGYKLPVVIDTPMARLDSAHRYNFINKYLPNASSQVIVLSTDEEVYGQYLEQIKSHVGSYFTLRYSESEKGSSIIPGYFEEKRK